MFERIKGRFGRTPDREPYPDTDDYQPPQAVEDPHTFEDGTHETLVEKALKYRWWLLSVSLLALAAFVLLAIYFGRYFVTVLMNPWVQRLLAALGILGTGLYAGRQAERGAVESEQELSLYNPSGDESPTFRGELRVVDGAPYDIFVPYKGNRGLFGGSPEPYRVGELSRALVKAHGHDPEAEARIRLHPEMSVVTRTPRGTRVLHATDGLEPDPHGQETNLEATLPNQADEKTVMEMTTLLESLKEENEQHRKEKDILRRQREEAHDMSRKRFDEFRELMEDQSDLFTKFLPARRRGSSQSDDDDGRRAADRVLEFAKGDDD